MSEITIANATGDSINVLVIGRTYPKEDDGWDGNWLNVRIRITAGRFSGKTEALLRCEELARFSQDIKGLIQSGVGEVIFSPTEPWLLLHLRQRKPDRFEVSGHATDRLGTGNMLKFTFSCPSAVLDQVATSIDAIIEKFPPK